MHSVAPTGRFSGSPDGCRLPTLYTSRAVALFGSFRLTRSRDHSGRTAPDLHRNSLTPVIDFNTTKYCMPNRVSIPNMVGCFRLGGETAYGGFPWSEPRKAASPTHPFLRKYAAMPASLKLSRRSRTSATPPIGKKHIRKIANKEKHTVQI